MPTYSPSEKGFKINVTDNPPPTLVEDMGTNGVVTTPLIATADTSPQNAEAHMALTPNDAIFYEIVRRIPEHKRQIIETRLKAVNSRHLTSIQAAIANQKNLLDDASFIHDEIFPFAALQAVRMGEISSFQFGSLMALWGNLENILPGLTGQEIQATPEFVPLFTVDGEKNPRASILLIPCLQPSQTLPNLVVKTPEELLKGIYEKAIHLPQSEQGFWVVEDIPPKSEITQTVTQVIKSLGVKFLAFDAEDRREMIPSFGLQQIFLDVAFPHAVRINPVIGDSTPNDIRKGSLERYRDIALPFPESELSKVADDIPAPSALDFMFHDRYHAVRASRVTPEETGHYVAIGDKLNVMQKRYDSAVTEFSKRHDEHIRLLPEFGRAIEKLPADKQREVTEVVLKKFNQEMAIIHKLKRMRKSNGQLKFRIWDMERPWSGSATDGLEETALQELTRIISNIEIDLLVVGTLPNTLGLSRYSGRRVAHAVLEVVKPEAATLTVVQNQMREYRDRQRQSFFYFLSSTPAQRAFDDAIIDAPVPQQLTS